MNKKKTANYKVISYNIGNSYCFCCDLSGATVCTTNPVKAETSDEELEIAWKNEGEKYFNRCQKCGKWVIDMMYNVEELQCVDCAPYESKFDQLELYGFGPNVMRKTKVCLKCGQIVGAGFFTCPKCGKHLSSETLFDQYKKRHICCPVCDTVLAEGTDTCPQCSAQTLKIDPKQYNK